MSLFNAEILAIGSELLTPNRIDTNSLWITDQLNSLGVEVVTKSIIGDDRARLTEAVQAAAARSEIVILTGGLGPTEDDVTRDAVAAAFGRGQQFREELLEQIAARFQRLNRPMAENNKRQAFLIDGAEALPNDRGTAPGQWLEVGSTVVALLPGPPGEMKAMFDLQFLPRLQKRLPVAVIRSRVYRVSCMPESDLDQLIAPVYTQYLNPVTTVLAAPGDIQVHLRARCETAREAEELLAELGTKIEELLGVRSYTATGETLEAVVGHMLKSRGATIATAESLTGGMLGARFTSVPGSSDYFRGGIVAYTGEMKAQLLGVDPGMLEKHTAVSGEVAEAMASGVRERLGTTWGLAVTGYAGPESGGPGKPAGTVFIGLAGPGTLVNLPAQFGGERDRIRQLTCVWSLDFLRRTLLGVR